MIRSLIGHNDDMFPHRRCAAMVNSFGEAVSVIRRERQVLPPARMSPSEVDRIPPSASQSLFETDIASEMSTITFYDFKR